MSKQQNAHLTFKENAGVSRHDWLRLTPAYSHRLVSDALRSVDEDMHVLDPFAGTATTGLVAAEKGMRAVLLDINPFLVWLGGVKTRNYTATDVSNARDKAIRALGMIEASGADETDAPPIHKIERWWPKEVLRALTKLKGAIDSQSSSSPSDDLVSIAFCLVMISSSNAAFNHQSMSFKNPDKPQQASLFNDISEDDEIYASFMNETNRILASACASLPGEVAVKLDDSRQMDEVDDNSIDLLLTSPPYANRMSYIRELRPYMYWLGHLKDSREAGEIDWKAIGGTWGVATSRIARWQSDSMIPLGHDFVKVIDAICKSGKRNADVLSRYVHKYFVDMFEHFQAAQRVLRRGGKATYIVGNSTFYGTIVPTELWYGKLLSEVGFKDITIERIRKRNSKKELFEFAVSASRV